MDENPKSDETPRTQRNRISIFQHQNSMNEIPVSSSLSLQIALFINVYLAPVWIISLLQFFYIHGFDDSGKHNQIVLGAALFTIAAPLEIIRLYLGYSGNLRKRIADFAGFLILSTFIQQPIEIYFTYLIHKMNVYRLQFWIHILATILVWFQMIIGFNAMRRMTRQKAQQFHIWTLIERSNRNNS